MLKITDIRLAAGAIHPDRRKYMRLIIDRFEGCYAVCETEDKRMVNIKRSELPTGTKEGDIIFQTSDGYKMDKEVTDKRRERISKLMNELWE
jgi:hypothetical protein